MSATLGLGPFKMWVTRVLSDLLEISFRFLRDLWMTTDVEPFKQDTFGRDMTCDLLTFSIKYENMKDFVKQK